MKMLALSISFSFLTLALGTTTTRAGDEKKNLKPVQRWTGKIGDDTKKKAAPKSGYVTSQDVLAKLWADWNVKGEVPKIDFTRQIIFVNMSSGPNAIGTSYTLNSKGDLTSISRQTLIAGPGFGYGIDLLNREGIKTYRGSPIE